MAAQDRRLSREPQFRPPRDSLIPPGHSTGIPSPIRDVQGKEQGSNGGPSETTPTRREGGQGGRTAPKTPHSLNKKSQKEERDLVIDAVKLITGAQTEIPGERRAGMGDTQEYDWDTGYD